MAQKSLSFGEIWKILDEEGVHPIRGLAKIAANNVGCTVCRGTLWTPQQLGIGHTQECYDAVFSDKPCGCGKAKHGPRCVPEEQCVCHHIGKRPCQSCSQTGMEAIAPALITRALEALTPLVAAGLKQVDNISSDDSMRPVWEMHVVQSPRHAAGVAGKTPPQLMAKNDGD